MSDRGLIAIGMKADINIISYDRLRLELPEAVYDLPGRGRRLSQKAHGIDATFVSGIMTYRDGRATGALPGRLLKI
jgi:N-acyl-D-aspartate/D-glutamate deacylase